MPPNNEHNSEHVRSDPLGDIPTTPQAGSSSPTFPSEAESLLRHLNLGPSQTTSPPSSEDGFPRIPNFEIECEIGRGGMGVVYKARHVSLNRTVALKMILTSAHASLGEVTRFLAEAEAIAAVRHPNVVEVHDRDDFNGRPYFVMEFIEGGNLATLLKAKGPLPHMVAAKLIATVALGVQAAHDAGIVHRDLKPGNILLIHSESKPEEAKSSPPDSAVRFSSFTLHPKVSDFGLAKRLASDMTRSQAMMGTPAYMAPEQAGGKAKFVGPAADVYALGVILYECLTGRPPFDSADTWSLIRQVLEEPPEPLRKRVPGVPRDLELICLKCLEKEPHHRYPTAAALADDLNRFLNGEPVSVRPVSVLTRMSRSVQRHPAPAALIVLIVLLLLIVPPLTVWQQGQLDSRDAVAAEAKKKEDAAKRAKDEANHAKIAAERLAATRELYALQNKFRTRAATRPLGWGQATRAELPRALQLADGEPSSVTDLRSTAATALLATDLVPIDPVAKDFTAGAITTDPKTGLVAIGEFRSWGDCRIRLINPGSGEIVRRLQFPTNFLIGMGQVAQDGTQSLTFGPDGKQLFAGTRGSRIMRFDLENPQDTPAKIWKASAREVVQLTVSSDGKTVYGLCESDPAIMSWAADTGKPLSPFRTHAEDPLKSFATLPTGELMATDGHSLYRWTADGKLVHTVSDLGGDQLVMTGGPLLLLSEGPQLGIYDRETLASADRLTDTGLRVSAHEDPIRTIAIHPTGTLAATAAGETERMVKVWELISGRLIGTVMATGTTPIDVAWSRDGDYLLVTSEGYIARWRLSSAQSQQFACASASPLEAATFLPDGRVAALSYSLNHRRELLVGPVGGRTDREVLPDHGERGRAGVTSAPNGMLAVTTHTPGILLWNPGTARLPLIFPEEIARNPEFGSDGHTLWILGSGEVYSYDPITKTKRGTWSNHLSKVFTGLMNVDALAATRTIAAAGTLDGAVYVLDADCKPVTSFRNAGDPVLAVTITPDESLVVTGTQNGLLRVHNLATRTLSASIPAHAGGTTAVAFNHDGTLLVTGGRDRSVRVWKRTAEQFQLLFSVSNLPGAVRKLQFSPNDGQLMVLLPHTHAVRIWDLNKLKSQLAELHFDW